MRYHTEFLIVGGGIVGLAFARELLTQGAEKIIILEKEAEVAQHASGRNSGVLHAGIYYAADSLKAKFCLEGNQLLKKFCELHHLPIKKTGKVIVNASEATLPILHQLYERGRANGAAVKLIDEYELSQIEPNAHTVQQGLYVEDTAVVDPKKIMRQIQQDLLRQNVKILFNSQLNKIEKNTAITAQDSISFKFLINATGVYAEKIAHQMGLGKNYQIVPFKGFYKKIKPQFAHLFHGNIYPLPDLRYPFLGVHFTKNIDGDVYLGPTAIPAFGRENYYHVLGMTWESPKILYRQAQMFLTDSRFRNMAYKEFKKYLPTYFYRDARKLVKKLEPSWIMSSPKVGIRAQLMKKDNGQCQLVDDFIILKDHHSLHILNAISPAFTSAFAFVKFVIAAYVS